jgi:lipopolysaccharide cholinephosphotransferase
MSKNLDRTELKKIQLDILDKVHNFCTDHNIKYYITYGTLIGAIRHKGYIPWDDDIDICMPRPDYNRFMKLFNLNISNFEFISYELDPHYPYTYGKVIDNRTKLIEFSTLKYPMGINIDVFPIDGVDEDAKILKYQIFLRNLLNIKTIRYSKSRTFYKNLFLLLSKLSLIIIPTNYIVGRMVKNTHKYSYDNSSKVCCVAMGTKLNKPVPKEYFDKGVLKEFEDREYYVPIGYDGYLKSIFGDYMKLPPEDKRNSHHVFEAYYKEG